MTAGIFIALCGVFKAVSDLLAFSYSRSIFVRFGNRQFWDHSISYRNKWKNGEKEQGEKFFLSSTLLAALTDGWHLSEMFRHVFTVAAVISYGYFGQLFSYWLDAIIFLALYSGTFHIFYTYIFISKFYKKSST